jgi:hypothetical protein
VIRDTNLRREREREREKRIREGEERKRENVESRGDEEGGGWINGQRTITQPSSRQEGEMANSIRKLVLRDGRQLAWREYGAESGYPVVFTHGNLNSR